MCRKIRCDGESQKILSFCGDLNKTLSYPRPIYWWPYKLPVLVTAEGPDILMLYNKINKMMNTDTHRQEIGNQVSIFERKFDSVATN